MRKFRNKYHIDTNRLPGWNYTNQGSYFITICCKDMIHFFGEIDSSGQMVLNELGQIAKNEWIRTKEIREDMNVDFGAFVVMPNHFHAILNIGENPFNKGKILLNGNNYGPQIKNLPSLIRGYKSSVTIECRKLLPEFSWQSRYYDIIIRSNDTYLRIENYINENPMKWKYDRYNNPNNNP